MAKNSLGFKGGLKGCERQLGLDRGNLKDIDGFFAVSSRFYYGVNINEPATRRHLTRCWLIIFRIRSIWRIS